jgi:hypothetical protein
MAINFTDFSDPNKWAQNKYEGISDLLPNILEGYKTARAPEMINADIAKKQAEAQRARMGGDFTGTLGNMIRLHQLKQNPNADPALINALQKQLDFEHQREQGIFDYQQKVGNTLMYRNAPALQKLFMNIDQLSKNKTYDMDGNEIALPPELAKQRRNAITMEVLQKTTDPKLRDRLTFAKNFETTLNNINPEEAFKYSGGFGGLAKKINQGKALVGAESEEYKKFLEQLPKLQIAADQFSQYMDVGAAEKLQKHVKELLNPNSWFKSPEAAMRQYKAVVDIFEQEYKNSLNAAVNPAAYGVDFGGIGQQNTSEDVLTNQMSDAISKAQPRSDNDNPLGLTRRKR